MPEQSISPQDELKLRWYFGSRTSQTQHSNTGAQFEAIAASNVGRFTCPVCDGDGVLYCGTQRAKRCDRCGGGGEVERSIHGAKIPRSSYVRCQECHGAVGLNPGCIFCHGQGFAVAYPAFCTHTSEALMVSEGDAVLFQRQGEMIRIMARLDDTQRAHAASYFGPEGDRWARTRHGRLFALYGATKAGGALLAKSPRAHRRLSHLERIAMLVEADRRIPDRERTRLLADAYLQARELLEQFESAWCQLRKAAA